MHISKKLKLIKASFDKFEETFQKLLKIGQESRKVEDLKINSEKEA